MMTDFASQEMTMTVLEQVLEVYGADLNRMPDALAHKVSAFIETDDCGRKLFNEAASMDEVLNIHTDLPHFDFNALEISIASSLQDDIEINPRAAANDNGWIVTSGLLAASLLLGLFFGSLGAGTYLFDGSGALSVASASMTDDIFYINEDFNLVGNLIAGIE